MYFRFLSASVPARVNSRSVCAWVDVVKTGAAKNMSQPQHTTRVVCFINSAHLIAAKLIGFFHQLAAGGTRGAKEPGDCAQCAAVALRFATTHTHTHIRRVHLN